MASSPTIVEMTVSIMKYYYYKTMQGVINGFRGIKSPKQSYGPDLFSTPSRFLIATREKISQNSRVKATGASKIKHRVHGLQDQIDLLYD